MFSSSRWRGVTCWGSNACNKTRVPAVSRIDQVALTAGDAHTCSLSSSGGVTCWGDCITPYTDFTRVPYIARANQVAVAAGIDKTCLLSSTGSVTCWGADGAAQMTLPWLVQGSQVAVVAGWGYQCSLSSAGRGAVVSWDSNVLPSPFPLEAQSDQIAVAAGRDHACLLSSAGRVICWGRNGYRQTTVPSVAQVNQVSVAAGLGYSCSLSSAGNVTCWGLITAPSRTLPAAMLPCLRSGGSTYTSTFTPTRTTTSTVAPASCPSSLYRTWQNKAIDGDTLATIASGVTVRDCQSACCMTTGCTAHAYAFISFMQSCFLRANATSLPSSSLAESGYWKACFWYRESGSLDNC